LEPGRYPLDVNARHRLAVARIKLGEIEEGKVCLFLYLIPYEKQRLTIFFLSSFFFRFFLSCIYLSCLASIWLRSAWPACLHICFTRCYRIMSSSPWLLLLPLIAPGMPLHPVPDPRPMESWRMRISREGCMRRLSRFMKC
jgi:hypothetical protein